MTTRISTLIMAGFLCFPLANAEVAKMRDAVKHDDLVKIQRAELAEGRRAESPVFTPAEGADPSVASRPESLLARSEILSFRGKATLVPKRALLHVPPAFSKQVGQMEGCKLVSWDEFYRENMSWISIHEVSIPIASGDEELDEDAKKMFSDRGKVVVATLMKGPVSVLPLKVAPEAAEGTEPVAVQK